MLLPHQPASFVAPRTIWPHCARAGLSSRLARLPPPQDPGFYPKNQLLLAQALAKLGKKAEAQEWLDKCLASTPKTPEDEQTLKDAAKIKF